MYDYTVVMEKKDDRTRGKGDAGRCTKQRSKKVYAKKRKTPNKNKKQAATKQPVSDVNIVEVEPNCSTEANEVESIESTKTASTEKVVDIEVPEVKEQPISGFRLLEMTILSKVLSILACPDCKNTFSLSLYEIVSQKIGLSSYLSIKCDVCDFSHQFYSSPSVTSSPDERRRGKKSMEINIRAVYGFRRIGIGHSLLTKLCGFLNMPTPMAKESYDHTSNRIKLATKEIAEKSMSNAAAALRKGAKTADVSVSVDGTWQRKGFSSTLGVITAISVDSGKVLDSVILSKSCKGCTKMLR